MVVARCQRGRAGIITWDALFLDVFFVSDVLIIAKKSKVKIPRQKGHGCDWFTLLHSRTSPH